MSRRLRRTHRVWTPCEWLCRETPFCLLNQNAAHMVPDVSEVLFNEPQGRSLALLQFGMSLSFLCMFAYAWSVGSAGDTRWLLLLVGGTALAGIAEALPKTRRQAAGVFRTAGILVLLGLVTAPITGLEAILYP